jgi:hypothetical protein
VTPDEARERLNFIRDIAGDAEIAHSEEDKFHRAVLSAIANGAQNPAELAGTALRTGQIEFERWCA